MRRLHAASETQTAVRVFQIFHNEQYVDYFRLSLATRELIPSANWTLAISRNLNEYRYTTYLHEHVCFVRRTLLHEIREGGPCASIDEDFRKMGKIRRSDETEDLQLRLDHVAALMRHKWVYSCRPLSVANYENSRPEVESVGRRTYSRVRWFNMIRFLASTIVFLGYS